VQSLQGDAGQCIGVVSSCEPNLATVWRADALATGIAIQDVPEGRSLRWRCWRPATSAGSRWQSAWRRASSSRWALRSSAIRRCCCPGDWLRGGRDAVRHQPRIIPESHRKGHEAFATSGLMIGFVLMLLLDTALG
jgi:ZIP family zinc transporter